MTGIEKYRSAALNLILSVSALLLLFFNLSAQGSGDLPIKPEMIRVTVDHSDNGVEVYWKASPDTTVDRYRMYKMDKGTGTLIYEFSSETEYYKITNDEHKTLSYNITSLDTLDGTAEKESLLVDDGHTAVAVSLEFDPCEPAISINWSAYVGWGNNNETYTIYGGITGSELQELGIKSINDRTFLHRGVSYNTSYSYYIETLRFGGMDTSLSPIVEIETTFPDAPAFIRVDDVSVIDKASLELRFTADVEGQVNNFRIMRRNNQDADYIPPFIEVETIWNSNQAMMSFTDQVPTGSTSYEYVVQAIHLPENCFKPIVVSTSNSGTSILLESSMEDQMAQLSWTPYESYATELSGYIIQRRSGAGEFIDVASVGSQTTNWSETIESVINGYQPGELQYKVIALSKQVEGSDPGISLSNIAGVEVETNMKVPSAFTPGRMSNYEFKPVIDFLPRKYAMIIYDRVGRKLFETTDPGLGWDGTYQGGNFAMEGVYVYFIQYTDYTGLSKAISGNVTVIYPQEF